RHHLVHLLANFAENERRRDDHQLVIVAARRGLVEALGNLLGKTLLADALPVGFLQRAAVGARAAAEAAGLSRTLLECRRIDRDQLVKDLKGGLADMTFVAQEKCLLPIGLHHPGVTFKTNSRHVPLLSLLKVFRS